MHQEILVKEQIELLSLIQSFRENFGLVGGTAIALYIGHRQSVDFDLFTNKEFDNFKIRSIISKSHTIENVLLDEKGQYTVMVNRVRFTFLYYPFPIHFSKDFNAVIKLPDLLVLAAMKAYALGRRAKWKDYVDLYFVMKRHFPIRKIVVKARKIFGAEFNEKSFRSQLAYFKDIDYTEKVVYLKGHTIDDEDIKKELIEFSLA